ncbi:MAG: hypothetical protein NC225_09580 [Clostridium sp.]|nr:hypothetical protein [Clostridium sp.]MCM1399713.1 hypothetical protein [Clostridium sp.]MCM1460452.1 hypothetical protein [Bacteroides sp.]
MKRVLLVFILFISMWAFCGCNEEELPELNQDKLIEITTKPIGMTEDYMSYALHICIYNDCSVEIYADDFEKLYDELEMETRQFSISSEELEELKNLILKERAYSMRESVGNRDLTKGTAKTFTVYGSFGAHKSGGLSPSNISFLTVYDFAYQLVREESIEYCRALDKKLLDGYNNRYDLGPRIHNASDERIVTTDMIEAFLVVPYRDILGATDSDADREAAVKESMGETAYEDTENVGMDVESDAEEWFAVAIILNDTGTNALAETTKGIHGTPENYSLYNQDAFCAMITVNAPVNDGVLYLSAEYDAAAAETLKNALDEYLEKWRSWKAEEDYE